MTANRELLSLPNELLLHVLGYLDNADIVQVRLVCRQLESTSIDIFGRRYFRHLLVIHHERSVARLQEIARRPKLNGHVSGELPKGDMGNQSKRCANWQQDLKSAIQDFPNLETFMVDNVSSTITERVPEELSHGEESCSCIFSVGIEVFQSLSNKPMLNLRISANDTSLNIDPKAQSWNDGFACDVSSLKLITCEEGDNTWEADLLYSLRNLQEVNIEGNVPDPTWAALSWSMLDTLELKDLYLPSDSFVAFITRHNMTLSSIALVEVTLEEGTWIGPLQEFTKLNKLNKLRHVHLLYLYQMDTSDEVSDPFKANFSDIENEVELTDSEIGLAAEVFRHHFWTTTLVDDTRRLVDLRLVKAAVDGEIKYEHGHWQFMDLHI